MEAEGEVWIQQNYIKPTTSPATPSSKTAPLLLFLNGKFLLRPHVYGPRGAVGSASDSRARGPGFDSRSGHIRSFVLPLIQEGWRNYVHEVLVNRFDGLSLPRKSVVTLTDRPNMTLAVNPKGKTTTINLWLLSM